MDVSWLSLLMMVAVFAASVLLAAVCLDCGNKSPLASISQTAASEEYVPSGFIVVHPCAGQARLDQNLVHSPSTLKPHPIPAGRGSGQPLRPYTPTETESNPSYENPAPGTDFPDSDAEGNGYIEVIPETEPSRASTPSLDSADYVNLEDENKKQALEPEPEEEPDQDSDSDSESDHNYENVKSANGSPAASTPDEDENYVNVNMNK
ncbi:linker for activation of T-cells family member 1-like isoform X2 [Poecilia formosa]|uniref:linker for activation of T-cells family member 1-like isoform X2 n=1 Tax=Poecilia formosa TaxID=48698 RepID=UPI000444748D|nr:PREDICTED: linker for activation of T-cells family member 1-like isoform X2 [Poecilia formosa]